MYPALTVVDALTKQVEDKEREPSEVLYVGSPDGIEKEIVGRVGLPYRAVDAGQVRGMSPLTMLQSLGHLARGYGQASRLLREWPADVALVTGGYVTVPVALAVWRRRIPLMVYLPDLEPGWAIRFLSFFATRIAVSFEEVCRFFPAHKVWVSGYPVREALFHTDRQAGYETLKLDPARQTLLVFGGSRGAQSINRAVMDILPDLLPVCQVIHISGQGNWEWVCQRRSQLPADLLVHYHPYPYLEKELPAAFATADLVVARAGAATLAEWPALGLPSILVPYPYSGQHQQRNADFMVEHGASVCIDDGALDKQLKPTIMRLLQDEQRLKEMGAKAQTLSRPDAAQRMAAELQRLAYLRGGRTR